ncbi:MAG: sulfite exporter TauE/SafE family protein [Vibrionaceae bacterium]
MSLWIITSYLGLGAVVGLLAGLLGIGGGILVVPALAIILPQAGISHALVMPLALATSLASIVFTSLSSSYSHYRLGNLDWLTLKRLLPGVLCGAVFGSFLANLLPKEQLAAIFGVIVLLLALQMTLSLRFTNNRPLPSWPACSAVGAVIGVVASLAGIGGGSLTVPYLNYHGATMRKAIGTSSLCGMFLAFFAMSGFIAFGLKSDLQLPKFSVGYVYLPALVGIVSTSMITTRIGAKLASHLPTTTIKRLFALFLFAVGLRMLLKG